ncbi:MAG: GapA-binding peptide SR1P [Paenibacillaceae bacterium]
MLTRTGPLHLGVILCKHCNCIIDTLDTDNVVTYYSECDDPQCLEQRDIKGENKNE